MTSTPRFRNRIVGQGVKPASEFLAHAYNWRVHPEEQQVALRGVLADIGWVDQVIENARTGNLIDGHARVLEALKDDADVPYLEVDLSEEEEALMLATFDTITGMAATDKDKLKELLALTQSGNPDVQALLSRIADAAGIGREAGAGVDVPDADIDRLDEIHAAIGAEVGDLWFIRSRDGKRTHRLVCGDSTDPVAVRRALGLLKPKLMTTDPPYGVDYDAAWREEVSPGANYATGKVENDDRVDWTDAYKLFPGDVAYVWHAGVHAGAVQAHLEACGFEIRAQIIWRKQNLVMSRGHYHWQHEPMWYAVRKGATAHWHGDRKQSTVWDIANMSAVNQSEDDSPTGHSTQKPAEGFRRPIVNHTLLGEAVYEPFSGSGTAIAAAEITGRVCAALELSPRYVSLTIDRLRKMGCAAARAEGE